MPQLRAHSEDRIDSLPGRDGRSDEELVGAAREKDLGAFDELVHRYQARIHATIYHMTSNREDADDLTQETFVKAYRALASFKGNSSFYTWVYRIAINRTLNFLKKHRRRMRELSLYDIDPDGEGRSLVREFVSDHSPHHHTRIRELQERLNTAMRKLSEVHRMVVVLHDVQGLPHEEIGRIMDCNTGTVRSRLFYARQQLQAHLNDYLK